MAKQTKDEKLDELLESHINGNLTYVREKFKKLSSEDKRLFLEKARNHYSEEDYGLFMKSIYT